MLFIFCSKANLSNCRLNFFSLSVEILIHFLLCSLLERKTNFMSYFAFACCYADKLRHHFEIATIKTLALSSKRFLSFCFAKKTKKNTAHTVNFRQINYLNQLCCFESVFAVGNNDQHWQNLATKNILQFVKEFWKRN